MLFCDSGDLVKMFSIFGSFITLCWKITHPFLAAVL